MGKKKYKPQLNENNCMELTKLVLAAGQTKNSIMAGKLAKLLYARVYRMQNIGFNKYLDEEKHRIVNDYVSGMNYGCATDSDNMQCDAPGWYWGKITGPKDGEELNRAEVFTWECTLFARSYEMYVAKQQFELDYTQFMVPDAADLLSDYLVGFEDESWYYEMEEDAVSRDAYAQLVVCGACYIECRLNNQPMPPFFEEKLVELYDTVYNSWCVGAKEYFNSFFISFMKDVVGDDAFGIVCPYLLDVHFSFKWNEDESTPSLYFYISKSMKEYKDNRAYYAGSKYAPYLDSLLLLLEDPMGARKVEDSDGFEQVDVLDMMYSECYSTFLGYTDTCYVGLYYWYEGCDSDKFYMNVFFKLARDLFEFMLECAKKEVLVNEMKAGA